jgi:hypothetical protein
MISVRLAQGKRGGLSARVTGHARHDVCLATSNAFHGFTRQVEQLASLYPDQIRIVNGKKP